MGLSHHPLPVPIRSPAASPGPVLQASRVAAPPARVMDVGRQPPLDEQHMRTQALRLRVIITTAGAQPAGIRGPGRPHRRFAIRDDLRGGEPRPYRGDIINRCQQVQTPRADEEMRQEIRNACSHGLLAGSIRMLSVRRIPFFDFCVTLDSHRVSRVRGDASLSEHRRSETTCVSGHLQKISLRSVA